MKYINEIEKYIATGFEWDKWNIEKIHDKHKVSIYEAEEVFLNEPVIGNLLESLSKYGEERYIAYGRTNANRLLTVIFTLRNHKIRVISARNMSKKERRLYHEENKKNTSV